MMKLIGRQYVTDLASNVFFNRKLSKLGWHKQRVK